MDRATVRVLFLGGGISNSFHLQRHLKESGCECFMTTCAEQCLALLDGRIFDLFLSTHPVHLGSALIQRLSRLSCSAFYRLAVEDGFWWVPVLDSGTECLGLPALRPIEFIETIDRIVADLRLSKANGARKAHRAAA